MQHCLASGGGGIPAALRQHWNLPCVEASQWFLLVSILTERGFHGRAQRLPRGRGTARWCLSTTHVARFMSGQRVRPAVPAAAGCRRACRRLPSCGGRRGTGSERPPGTFWRQVTSSICSTVCLLVTQLSAFAVRSMASPPLTCTLCCMQRASLLLHPAVACNVVCDRRCVAALLTPCCPSCRATLPAAAPGCCRAVCTAAPEGLAVDEGWRQGHLSGRSAPLS